MYIFKSSFLRAKNSKDGYQNVNIAVMQMSAVLDNYIDGYIVLTHTQLQGTFYMTVSKLRSNNVPMYTDMIFNRWLQQNNTIDLNLTKIKPEYTQSTVEYSDAIKAAFAIDRVGRYMSVDANISNADKVDLLLRKNIPNKNELYTRIVATVNGFAHKVFAHEDGIALAGGGRTFNNTGINTVGILSFSNACTINQYAITEDMITQTNTTIPLANELLINLGMSLVNKSIMLSIGGYLFINKGVGEIINPETGIILVKLDQLDVVDMIINSVGIIDLTALGVFADNKALTYNKVRVNDIKSDVCIRKYMSLEQSFIIVADTECIQTEYINVSVTGIPGTYESTKEPTYPLIDSKGLLPEYWKIRSEDYWSIKLTDDVTKRRIHKSNIDYNNKTINSISATHAWYHDDPKFMKITVTSKQ